MNAPASSQQTVEPTVYIVDDEASVRDSLAWLLSSIRLPAACFDSAAAFIAACPPQPRGCLILDVRMPGMSGIELMDLLAAKGIALPIIFLSAHGDIPMATDAMRKGAIDFLSKPYNNEQFLSRVRQALAVSDRQWQAGTRRVELDKVFGSLTKREWQLLDLIISGSSNKEIARELDISVKTVEAHRARLTRKLEVRSLAELVQLTLEFRRVGGVKCG